jgi:hypothetical protein
MPDAWELANGLDATADDAEGDADSDGLTNEEEYAEDTDPQRGRSGRRRTDRRGGSGAGHGSV